MQNAGLDKSQARISISRRNINNLRYADDTTLMAESEEELKNLLMKVKEESEKVGLKLNTEKTKIMASGPTTSWQIDGETMKTIIGFISFWVDCFDLLAAQGTLKSLLQHHNSKPSISHHSAFFMVQLSLSYMTAGKTTVLAIQTFAGKVMSCLS